MNFSTKDLRRHSVAALASVVVFLLLGDAVLAQAKSNEPEKPPAQAQPAASVTTMPATTPGATSDVTANVEGFRSAKFGMTEADVRAAIGKDFPGAANAIKEATNLAERTKILTIKTPDVLADSGGAEVSYIFGYKSKTLIQVSIIWSKATDATLTPEALVANGEGLRGYFLGEGFPPSAVVSNVALPDGILLFRGADKQAREVLLVVKGSTTGDGNAPKTFTAAATTLFYIAKTTNPDVFKVPAGKF